jgi:hypothetical protein
MMTVPARMPWQRLQWVGSLGIDIIMYPTWGGYWPANGVDAPEKDRRQIRRNGRLNIKR